MTKTIALIAALLFLFSPVCFSQNWHAASDTLELPPSPGGFYPSIGSFHEYDTVKIVYQTTAGNELHHGFKRVHRQFGYYVDDASTMMVFFDERMRRLDRVARYYFQ